LGSTSRLSEAIKALKMALLCFSLAAEVRAHLEDDSSLKIRRLELLFQLANLYEESKNRQKATAYLEICLDEAGDSGNGHGGSHEIELPIARVKSKTHLLLSQWAMDDGDYSQARWLAHQIEQDGELAEEAQQILRRCAAAQDPT
jgi:tetratricopeptide (TPR) repeat protein